MQETTRPIVCLVFVLPLLFIYELGSIFTDQLSEKSGIDQWIHHLMEYAGAGHLVLLPLLTAGVLLLWHHQIEDNWRINPRVLFGMCFESAALGMILYFAGNAVCQFNSTDIDLPILAISNHVLSDWWSSTIAYIGCGVYEELIFRLLLLNGLIYLGSLYCENRRAKFFGMILTSLLFAALHFDFFDPNGAVFDSSGFIFRFLASVIFCLLFLFRGFGIEAGTHCI